MYTPTVPMEYNEENYNYIISKGFKFIMTIEDDDYYTDGSCIVILKKDD